MEALVYTFLLIGTLGIIFLQSFLENLQELFANLFRGQPELYSDEWVVLISQKSILIVLTWFFYHVRTFNKHEPFFVLKNDLKQTFLLPKSKDKKY